MPASVVPGYAFSPAGRDLTDEPFDPSGPLRGNDHGIVGRITQVGQQPLSQCRALIRRRRQRRVEHLSIGGHRHECPRRGDAE